MDMMCPFYLFLNVTEKTCKHVSCTTQKQVCKLGVSVPYRKFF